MSSRRTNAAVLGRVLRDLRRDGRIDDLAELLATLAATSAKLVDVVCASDSTAKEYAQAAVVKAHTKVLVELAGRVGPPVADKDDPWQRIADALSPDYPVPQESDEAGVPDWDQVEAEVAKDSPSWPSAS